MPGLRVYAAGAGMTTLRRASLADLDVIVALQHAAYAQNRALLGVEPLPLQVDYREIVGQHECWLAERGDACDGCLILDLRADDLLIWSIATPPNARGRGTGNLLLTHADQRARESGRAVVRLYTGEKLASNIAWYARHGFTVERVEQMPDRRAVHMIKTLNNTGRTG